MKELYHGTIADFNTIDVSVGKGYKDFGKGFYATAVASHVEKMMGSFLDSCHMISMTMAWR